MGNACNIHNYCICCAGYDGDAPQPAIGIICMVLVGNLQIGLATFVNPTEQADGGPLPSTQFEFGIFIVLQTRPTPIRAGRQTRSPNDPTAS